MITVGVYGSSLALASIGASLQGHAELHVIGPDATLGSEPDVVVFDLDASQPTALALCQAHPQSLLIGVSVESHQALVFPGDCRPLLTSDDLVRIIESLHPAERTH